MSTVIERATQQARYHQEQQRIRRLVAGLYLAARDAAAGYTSIDERVANGDLTLMQADHAEMQAALQAGTLFWWPLLTR